MSLQDVQQIIETVYFASLIPEEGKYSQFTVAFTDDSIRRGSMGEDDWEAREIAGDREFSPKMLAKLRAAAPLDFAQFGVRKFNSQFLLTWLLDYPGGTYRFSEGEMRIGYPRPGSFEVIVEKPGQLLVIAGHDIVGRIKGGAVITLFMPVLWAGPVSNKLEGGLRQTFGRIQHELGEGSFPAWLYDYRHSLQLILRDMEVSGFGGAILITKERQPPDIEPLNGFQYQRLRKAITFRQANRTSAEANQQLVGSAKFIGRLTRVDGLVVLSPDATVLSFGSKINSNFEPISPTLALNVEATEGVPFDITKKGTRHLSMLRYCSEHHDAIGLVVSQDGDVSAITFYAERVVIWENIKTLV